MLQSIRATDLDCLGGQGHAVPIHRGRPLSKAQAINRHQSVGINPSGATWKSWSAREHGHSRIRMLKHRLYTFRTKADSGAARRPLSE